MFRFFRILLSVTFLLGTALVDTSSYAQSASVPEQEANQRKPTDPATWTGILDSATQAIERKGVTEKELDRIISETNNIRDDATKQADLLQPRLDGVSQQLSELGKIPDEDVREEPQEVQKRRKSLNEQVAELDAKVKAARLAVLRAQQIQRTVVQTRQSKFFRSISVRSEGVFTFGFWSDFVGGITGYTRSFNILISDSFKIGEREVKIYPWKMGVLAFFLIAAIYILLRVRRFLTSLVLVDNSEEPGAVYRSRFVEFCRDGLLPALFIFVVYRIFAGGGLLSIRLGNFFANVSGIVAFYIMFVAMLRIILLPREGRARILLVNDLPARRITTILTIGLGISSVLAVFNAIAIVVVSRLTISVGLSFLFAMTVAITFLIGMWTVHRDRHSLESLNAIVAYTATWRFARAIVQGTTIAIFVAAVFGYIALAEFLAQQLVFGLVVVGSVWLILRFVHVLTTPAIDLTSSLTETEINGNSRQFVILATGLLTLVLYLAAAILLLLPWGYRTSDFYQVVQGAFFGFEIGGLRISVSTILLVSGLFVLGYWVTVSLRNWLNNKLLPTTALDVGVSNSISTVFGYTGFVLAAILAVSVAGFDLSNLAIVAGALSVGVGFGLQSIVNNFVSGLILLAERPIKAGDWIATSGGEGTVTKISVRSTEIETFNRSTVIIPNSTLITDNVTNYTHEDKIGRIIIAVGVGYNSDVEQVQEILLNCAQQHRLVLGRPEPAVFFMDFGANSLDFELRCFLADINYCLSVQSELRFAVLKALREAEIEIPFPQRDIHIKSGPVSLQTLSDET